MKKSVRYANFHITNAATKYALLVNGYTGTLADALKRHNRKNFATFNSDNDPHPTLNCASHLFGAWWFDNCHWSHLNGKYLSGGKMAIDRSDRIILIHTGILGTQMDLMDLPILWYLQKWNLEENYSNTLKNQWGKK